MKVFLVSYDVGEYSDRRQGVLEVFSDMEKAEAYVTQLCSPADISDEKLNELYLEEVARLEERAAQARLQAQTELNAVLETRRKLYDEAERRRLENGPNLAYEKALTRARTYGVKQEAVLVLNAKREAFRPSFALFRSSKLATKYQREELSIDAFEVK